MHRLPGRGWVRTRLSLAAAVMLVELAVLGIAPPAAGGQDAPTVSASYEGVASAEGVRISFGAPGFVAVETFIDGGGPIAQSVIDGLGNSQAFASFPYPGDLAVSGPGLVAGLTGLPSPPPYPFYVASSHPTVPQSKLTQPGYELAAKSLESESEASVMTGGAPGGSASASSIGSTVTRAATSRDARTGVVTAEASGMADIVNIGGVLRIGQVVSLAKVTRNPGTEPIREASFVINGMTIAGQTVGFSDQGFTFGGATTPIPQDNPLLEALKQARITVRYLARADNPDGVVSPGLVITQEQATPGGPTMVTRYVFGQMAASAMVSGGSTSIGQSLPLVSEASADVQVNTPPVEPTVPSGTDQAASPAVTDDSSGSGDRSEATDSGLWTTTDPTIPGAAVTEPAATAAEPFVQEAAPTSRAPMSVVDTASIYLILVAAAAVALAGGTVLRLVGVKLKWIS